VAGRLAKPAPGEPQEQLVGRHVDEQGRLDRRPALRQGPVERLGLGAGTREAVEDHAPGGIGRPESLQQHPHGDLVRDERTPVHVLPGLGSERRSGADRGAEEVAGGHPGKPQVAGKDMGLGTLPGPGRTEQDEDSHWWHAPGASAVTG
jgi:hypothetical protein